MSRAGARETEYAMAIEDPGYGPADPGTAAGPPGPAPDPSFLLRLAEDPGTTGDLLIHVFRHPVVAGIRREVETNPYAYADYPGHHVDEPARREQYLGRLDRALAAHPNAPPELLRELARDRRAVEEVARNPSVPPDLLETLVHGSAATSSGAVRAVAANPAAPPGALERIALTGAVSDLVLAHPAAPPSAREAAGFVLGHAEAGEPVLRAMIATRSLDAIRAVASHPATPAAILTLVIDNGSHLRPWLLLLVAEHPNAGPSTLATVAGALARVHASDRENHRLYRADGPDEYQQVLRALRGHAAFDEDALVPLAGLLPLLDLPNLEKRRLAADPDTDPATLEMLAADLNEPTLMAVAANPAAPPAALETLLDHEVPGRTSFRLEYNPATTASLLRRVHQRAPAFDRISGGRPVRLALARHPNTPADVLEQLAAWNDPELRALVAERTATPEAPAGPVTA